MTPEQQAKQAAGKAAAALIEDGMLVGLGTGSTAAYFIESLIERGKNGLQFSAVATSSRSEKQAREGGLLLHDISDVVCLDVAVDGADEIDPQKRMIKGGGGALLREKIIASMSREMIVIIDETKLVDRLGDFPLPVEITPFACQATLYKIREHGYAGNFRRLVDGSLYVTDNGNYIVDIVFPQKCDAPEKDNNTLKSIPGVMETGFFFNMAGRVVIGYPDGTVKMIY